MGLMESGISEPAHVSATPPLSQQYPAAPAADSQPIASTADRAAWRSSHHRSQAGHAKLSATAAASLLALRQSHLKRQEQHVEIPTSALIQSIFFLDSPGYLYCAIK